jgi:hypothetical protein
MAGGYKPYPDVKDRLMSRSALVEADEIVEVSDAVASNGSYGVPVGE